MSDENDEEEEGIYFVRQFNKMGMIINAMTGLIEVIR